MIVLEFGSRLWALFLQTPSELQNNWWFPITNTAQVGAVEVPVADSNE